MTEGQIRKEVIKKLKKEGWLYDYKPKTRFQHTDLFNCWDIVAIKEGKIKFIQFTSLPNIRTREKKIKDFLKKNNISIYSEIWGWDKKKKEFKIIFVYS